jgi:DNA mismatch endonuclease (patch repair protein)
MPRTKPSFVGLAAVSESASKAARGSSRKRDTRCELLLRRELWRRGLRYRIDVRSLPGRPDIVLARARVAVFCDGDFWHGRDLERRSDALAKGHNAPYWVAKIRTNVERDRSNTRKLEELGWEVLRLWETEILRDVAAAADKVAHAVTARSLGR